MESAPAPSDAGGLVVEAILPEGPAPAAGPSFRCPAEWTSDDDGACSPPKRSSETCPHGERRGPGGCLPIAPPCPASGFPAEVPERAYFVRPDAGFPRDGSRQHPYADVFTALREAYHAGGGTVVLAPGTYPGPIVLEDGLHLLGACLDVVITGADVPGRGVIESQGPDTRVAQLTIRTSQQRGAQVLFSDNALHLRGVWIEGGREAAINVGRGGSLTAEDVVVRAAGQAAGVVVQEASAANLAGVEIRDAGGVGVRLAGEGTTGTLEDVLIADTQVGATTAIPLLVVEEASAEAQSVRIVGSAGHGALIRGGSLSAQDLEIRGVSRVDYDSGLARPALAVGMGGSAELTGVSIDEVEGAGARVEGEGSELVLRQARIRAREPAGATPGELPPAGVTVAAGARATLQELLVEGPFGTGVILGAAEATDLWVRDLRDPRPGRGALGVSLYGEGTTLRRLRFSDFSGVAVYADESTWSLEDLEVRSIDGFDGDNGVPVGGAIWLLGAELRLRRARFVDVGPSGFAVIDSGGRLEGEDLVVDGSALPPRDYSPTISAGEGEVVLRRARFLGASGWTISLEGTRFEASDLHVGATRPIPFDWALGWGVGFEALAGSTVRLADTWIEGSEGAGLLAAGEGTEVELSGVTITETAERSCAEDTCADEPGGMALAAYRGAALTGDRVVIRGADFCGLHVGPAGTLDLRSSRIGEAAIGACLHPEGFDLRRITDDVVFETSNGSIAAPETPDRPSLLPPEI